MDTRTWGKVPTAGLLLSVHWSQPLSLGNTSRGPLSRGEAPPRGDEKRLRCEGDQATWDLLWSCWDRLIATLPQEAERHSTWEVCPHPVPCPEAPTPELVLLDTPGRSGSTRVVSGVIGQPPFQVHSVDLVVLISYPEVHVELISRSSVRVFGRRLVKQFLSHVSSHDDHGRTSG